MLITQSCNLPWITHEDCRRYRIIIAIIFPFFDQLRVNRCLYWQLAAMDFHDRLLFIHLLMLSPNLHRCISLSWFRFIFLHNMLFICFFKCDRNISLVFSFFFFFFIHLSFRSQPLWPLNFSLCISLKYWDRVKNSFKTLKGNIINSYMFWAKQKSKLLSGP